DMDATLRHYAYGDKQGNLTVGNLDREPAALTLQARELGAGARMPVANVCFSPDGSLLGARFFGGAVVVWDLATKKPLMAVATNSTKELASDLTFSPDSKRVIFADVEAERQIAVYEVATGRRLSLGIQAGINFFRLRPDGRQVAMPAD